MHLAGTVQTSPSLQGHEQPQVEPSHPLPRAQGCDRAPELPWALVRGCAGRGRAGEGNQHQDLLVEAMAAPLER